MRTRRRYTRRLPAPFGLRTAPTPRGVTVAVVRRGRDVARLHALYAADATYVTSIWVEAPLRGRGVAHLLLYALASESACDRLELDDMSDRAWSDRNLYRSMGFEYLEPCPNPEMAGSCLRVLATWDWFYDKYVRPRTFLM